MNKKVQNLTRRGELNFLADAEFDNEIVIGFVFDDGYVFDSEYDFILNLKNDDDTLGDNIDLSDNVSIDIQEKEIKIMIPCFPEIIPGDYKVTFKSKSKSVESKLILIGLAKFI